MNISIQTPEKPEETLPRFAVDAAGALYLLHHSHGNKDAIMYAIPLDRDRVRFVAAELDLSPLPRGSVVTFEV